ncbi:6-hydroxymethylpterin diphosphokinase MptE-like protein [Haloprofundus halophilus]|uniref:6-hydroxymethylpterin diphosphokinase MptE-like protein n=1 Tax=Haloprofundus halophilus TaxID=2283527 RepID=UPI000E431B6F|nr:6-hydroxymethylpterin diphosphokinase MptE-like protein [Haloprofundus halophilus]
MNFETWEPVYERILADFGFDRSADERARDDLARLAEPFDESRLRVVDGETVAVVGAAPSLPDEVDRAADADYVFAASTAADVLRDRGVAVDLMVTDLDKNPETARELTREGVAVAAHAHGDNRPAIREWVPRFDSEHVLATTQAAPVGPVVDYGGFTDGDRAAFLADEFGAEELTFVGWQFDDPTVDEAKARKLAWAERLLGWLERRRGERFSVLDGRRPSLDLLTSESEVDDESQQ